MNLTDLGELQIIQIIERELGTDARSEVGFGDDISAIRFARGGKVAVLKTDMLVGSTDIPPGMDLRQAARKSVAACVSDLAAKGVKPLAGVVALGLPPHLTKINVRQIGSGLADAMRMYRFPIVGGDTNASNDLTISLALFALTNRKRLVLRSGARVGDLVAVTGEFGSTSAGLKAVLEERLDPRRLARELHDAVYEPRAELDLGIKLAASGSLSGSIDSSDGLARSLHELAKASDVGILIDEIPISKAALDFARRYDHDPYDLALYGGEEYHLVVSIKPDKFRVAQRKARGRLRAIGVVVSKSNGVRLKRGSKKIAFKGWEHFKC